MELQKKKTFSVVIAIASIVLAIGGFVLISLLDAVNEAGTPVSFMALVNKMIEFFNGVAGTTDPAFFAQYIFTLVIVLIYLVTFVSGLVFIIKLIVDAANINKEGSEKRITANALGLGYTLIIFLGLLAFFIYATDVQSPGLGAYLGFAAGAVIVVLACVNFFLTSGKPLINKIFRACLSVVAIAASALVLMPALAEGTVLSSPFYRIYKLIESLISGGAIDQKASILYSVLFVLFVLASSFTYSVGRGSVSVRIKGEEKKEVSASVGLMIALSAVACLLSAAALFGGPLFRQFFGIVPNYSLYAYIGFGLLAAMLVVSIVVAILSGKEKAEPKPAEEAKVEAEPEPEAPAMEEEPMEEEPKQEVVEEAAAVVIASEAIADEPAEEPKVEAEPEPQPEPEAVEEQPAEEPVEEQPAEEQPAEAEEAPAEEPAEAPEEEKPVEEKPKAVKKPAAKKPAEKKPAEKKPAAKKPAAEKKPNASYHISKRASDNKWQVFRAGSDKVIKLFDTKVEAEEYTKRMAENQGVGYLSHASKGKNKGKIQKK